MSSFKEVFKADLALLNGKVITVDPEFRVAKAVAVKAGRIIAIGSTAELTELVGAETEIIDLQGKTVLPGFVDSHLHMLSTGLSLFMINCRTPPMTSIADNVASVNKSVK